MMYLSAVRAQVRNFAGKFIKNERGVTAIEYAIVAAGVSAVLLVIFDKYNGPVYKLFNSVFTALEAKLLSIMA
ncbi:Flp family type IVb pilin [Gilliamella apicola]|uniref:Flp family type IVb pilin n=1 Tax=Gilliamella apicola TaxID=1196095 RepID=UPI003987BF4C